MRLFGNVSQLIMLFSLCAISFLPADIHQEFASLSIHLSLLKQLALAPVIGTSQIDVGFKSPGIVESVTFNNITYTLDNGKKIRVEVGDLTKLNTYDITKNAFKELNVDALVNDTDQECIGGGTKMTEIDEAIHQAVDATVQKIAAHLSIYFDYKFSDVCENLPELLPNKRCTLGDAKVVPGMTLAKWIVQAVGPKGGEPNSLDLLKRTYENCLKTASQDSKSLAKIFDLENNWEDKSNKDIYGYYHIAIPADLTIKSLTFPPVSLTTSDYTKEQGAEVIVATVCDYLITQPTSIEEVRFVIYHPSLAQKKDVYKEEYNLYVEKLNKKLGFDKNLGKQS